MAHPMLGKLGGLEKVNGSCCDGDLPTLVHPRAPTGSQQSGVIRGPRKQVPGPSGHPPARLSEESR